jgi:hypothetical protein
MNLDSPIQITIEREGDLDANKSTVYITSAGTVAEAVNRAIDKFRTDNKDSVMESIEIRFPKIIFV